MDNKTYLIIAGAIVLVAAIVFKVDYTPIVDLLKGFAQ